MPMTGETKRVYERKRKMLWKTRVHTLLGGECVICGTTEGLEIHHTNPESKSRSVSRHYGMKWENQIKELLTCELRCEEHHKDAHAALHGSTTKYKKGCRCSECVKVYRAHRRISMAKYRAEGRDKTRKNYNHGSVAQR